MDEDEDLRRAIELSLQESQARPPRPVINVDDEEAQFQRDMEMAMQASMAETSTSKPDEFAERVSELPTVLPQTQRMSSFLLAREERLQLEKERLERQKKRLREGPEKRDDKGKGRAITEDEIVHDIIERPGKKARMNGMASNQSEYSSSQGDGLFWSGIVSQIANRFVDKDKNTRPVIRLSDIITQKENIEFAIIASYASMQGWMRGFFDSRTPVISVVQPDETGNSRVIKCADTWILTTPFLRGGRGCQHIKLILLFYKDGRLRIAIPTANFVDYDWRDIENTAWVQDIPKRQAPIRHDAKATDFPATLSRVLHSLNVTAAMNTYHNGDINLPIETLKELRMRWDWSKVTAKLVVSLAGKHEGWEHVNQSGHPALAIAIKELCAGAGRDRETVLECQGSSIGTYSTQWMNEFHCSARGESTKNWLDNSKASRAKLPWPPVKIIFPSLQTVKNSVLGVPGGGTIFCRKTQWEATKFPRELFYDSKSRRGAVLMHTKMILATFRPKSSLVGSGRSTMPDEDDEDTDNERDHSKSDKDNDIDKSLVGWLYVGSHNFTPSAWGTLSGTSSKPSLSNMNYEMGIVLPLKSNKEIEDIVCWERPARKYVLGKDRAWMQDEILGNLKDDA